MNKENNKEVFQCICGKQFNKYRQFNGHRGGCKIYKDSIKDRKLQEQQELESKKLPNGMFKCENPDCGKEHDGSYGSGRFCCEKCKKHYIGITSAKTSIKNGTKKCPKNFKIDRSPYGTWKCLNCEFIANTKAELIKHKKETGHHGYRGGVKGSKLSEEHKQKIRLSLLGKSNGRCKDPIKELERRKKISETAKLRGSIGGRRQGSGRGKQGWYKGYWCDSSWELAWVIYNLDHNIKFVRYNGYFEYEFNGKIHKYYPDFQLEDGTIVEIKGYKTEQWLAKLKQFPKKLKLLVIGKNEIKIYLNYVIKQYGEKFIELYENGKLVELANTSALNTEVHKDMRDRDPHFPPFLGT